MKREKGTLPRIGLIGAGSAGTALVLALHEKGYPIVGVASLTLASAERCARLVGCGHFSTDSARVVSLAEVLIIATPDGVIRSVCEGIANKGAFREGQIVVHLSGALTTAELDAARSCGASALALHPMQTFSDPQQGALNMIGCFFSLEGDPEALAFARELVEAFSGRAFVVPEEGKVLYHAALCVASNYLVTIVDLAAQLLERVGIERGAALAAMLPLIQGTVNNLARDGLPDALTGPISRGDAAIIARHLDAIADLAPEMLDLYRRLGQETLRLAKEKGGLDAEGEQAIRGMLQGEK
ncbi:MAG: Rossmann-like and DUF2520 domain-containing protein [Candidatus Latescibacterota bacterium]